MESPSINLASLPTPSRSRKDAATQSIESILMKNRDMLGITVKQLEKLVSVKQNGEYILNQNNPAFFYEIFGMLKKSGFETTYEFLQYLATKDEKFTSKDIFKSQLFEKEEFDYQYNISLIRDQAIVKTVGLFKCSKCTGDNTIVLRSIGQLKGDEAEISTIVCQSCGHRQKIG